jgi:steroid delta-isomerase-like uncharacterized protein
MSVEENKALVRRWVELWNTQNVAAVDDFVTADYVRHDPNVPEIRGPEGEKQLISMALAAFPDMHIAIEDLIAEGDRVVGRLRLQGTQRGEWMGIPPTNRTITIDMLEIYRLSERKIAEQWVILDALGMLQQMGVVPTPGQ